MWQDGPKDHPREARLALAREIAARAVTRFPSIVAVGAYGSLARGEDGPFSDIEMHCVVEGDALCQRCDGRALYETADAFWRGVARWAIDRRLSVEASSHLV